MGQMRRLDTNRHLDNVENGVDESKKSSQENFVVM